MKNIFTGELTWKSLLVFLGLVAAGVSLFYAGRLVLWKFEVWPRSASSVRAQVFRYIRTRSGTEDFQIQGINEAEQDTNSPGAQLTALREELSILQTNMALINARVRSNKTEVAALTTEIKKLSRPPAAPVRRKKTNSPPLQIAEEKPSSTNLPANLTNSASAALSLSESNQALLAAKQKLLAAKQKEVDEAQKQLQAISQDIKPLQKNVSAKQRELAALQKGTTSYSKLVRDLNRQLQEVMSWEALYKTLGQELWLAERLIASTNPLARAAALQLVDQARSQALGPGENPWLAARICEGFIWPNIQFADADAKTSATRDQLLTSAGLTFHQAQETNHYLQNAQMLIANSTSPVRVDYTRYQLGLMLESMGAYEQALEQYKAIQYSNSLVYAAKRIPLLQEKLQQLKGKKG